MYCDDRHSMIIPGGVILQRDLHKADYSMSKTITWIATAVTFAVPMTLLICKLHSKRKENLVNRRYTTDDILFDI